MGMDEEFIIMLVMVFVLVGIGIIIGSFIIVSDSLDQETLDDICQQLLGNESLNVEAHSENGKLICTTPSFDNTQNIIFKGNAEDG